MPRWPLLLPLLLAACAGGPEHEAEAAQAMLAAHRASLEALGAPAPRPTPERPAATAPLPPASPPASTAASPTAPWQASSLMGASPEAVLAALGEPLLRRAEGPAQIWLYTGGGCQVDIVLYAAEAGPRVAHVQARAGGLTQRTEASCLRDISAQAGRSRAFPPGPSSLGQPTEIDV